VTYFVWDTVSVFQHKNYHKTTFKFHKLVQTLSGEVENVCSTYLGHYVPIFIRWRSL